MKFVDEYRDRTTVETLLAAIRSTVRHPWTIMEICGGQTHAIVKHVSSRKRSPWSMAPAARSASPPWN